MSRGSPNTKDLEPESQSPGAILVTGCAGFIGSNVCHLLLNQGHTVVGLDNMNNAYDVRLKEWRLGRLTLSPSFTFCHLDITDFEALGRLFDPQSAIHNPLFDAVINLAARAGVRQSLEDPWVYYDTNVTGTLNLLELCKQHGIPKFVLASSSSVYGSVDDREAAFREEQGTDRPLSPYAASKKAAETLTYSYHCLHEIDCSVLRYFTVYGRAGRPDMSIFRFVRWIAESEPLTLYGDGTQKRDFTYVDDIARGTVAALRSVGYDVINLGSDNPISINDVIDLLEDLLGQKALIEYLPAQPADVPATWADISRAKGLLNWQPEMPFEDGLRNAVEWYRENRSWARELDVR